MDKHQILVLGIGNILLSDEGVGIHVIRELEKQDLPQEVQVLDGGTTGFELIRLFAGIRKVIMVDAIKADMEVGTLVRLTPSNLQMIQEISFSTHQSGISTIVKQAALHYPDTEIVIIGVVVREVDKFGMQLTDKVNKKITAVIAAILREIELTDVI